MNAATCQKNLLNLLKKEETFTLEEEDIVVCRKKVGSLGDQKLEEKVRLSIKLCRKVLKSFFPKVIFFDSENKLVPVGVGEVMKAASCFETLLVMCKKEQVDTKAIGEGKELTEKFKEELAQKAP